MKKGRSFNIYIKREWNIDVPFPMLVENNIDWSHFAYLHKNSHRLFQLLYKRENREIFLYKARLLPFLPFGSTFICFREYLPEQHGFRALYYNVRSGRMNVLNASTLESDHSSTSVGEFVFSLPWYWRYFPGLFFWIINRRQNRVSNEDLEMFRERVSEGKSQEGLCGPDIPGAYDLCDGVFEKIFACRDVEYTYSYSQRLNR